MGERMRKIWLAAVAGIFLVIPVHAQTGGDDILKTMINSPSADSWSVWNATIAVIKDDTVQGGKASRITVAKKGEHSWDASASDAIVKPVKKGDVILVAYWARVEVPPEGSQTASLPSVSIGINKTPYTTFVSEAATITRKWAMYYASGVADADYKPGDLNVGIQLATDKQVIDLGPVFVLDFGPDYDRTKLPHNKIVATVSPPPAAAAPASPETRFADALAKLRAKLPMKGTLISDPGQQPFLYGNDQSGQLADAADVPGGKALHVTISKAAAHPWDDGASLPLTGDIKKGDTVFLAAYVRASAGQLSEIGVHMAGTPWTPITTAAPTLPPNKWTLVYSSGIAASDYKAADVNVGMQLGCCQQTLDLGPIFVLNLGQGVALTALPKN